MLALKGYLSSFFFDKLKGYLFVWLCGVPIVFVFFLLLVVVGLTVSVCVSLSFF